MSQFSDDPAEVRQAAARRGWSVMPWSAVGHPVVGTVLARGDYMIIMMWRARGGGFALTGAWLHAPCGHAQIIPEPLLETLIESIGHGDEEDDDHATVS